MKRVIVVLTFFVLSLFLGCVRADEHLLFNDSNMYIQELDIMIDPVLILDYDGMYTMKIEEGQVIKLIKDNSIPLSLDNEENLFVSECIYTDSTNILKTIKICLNNGYYSDWKNVPSAETPYAVYIDLTEEGYKLFPESNAIEQVSISVSFGSNQETSKHINSILTKHYMPKGMNVYIQYKNGLNTTFLYGEFYNQTIVTWDEVTLS